jgi:S1-C subfamily serine protease
MKLLGILILVLTCVGCVGRYSPSVHVEYVEKETVGVETKVTGGTGTGFLVSRKGYVMTAAHVIRPRDVIGKVYVRLAGPLGPRREAKVIAVDYVNDLALLKIAPSSRHRVFKFCDRVRVGEWVKIVAFRHPQREKTMGTVLGYFSGSTTNFVTDAVVDYGFSGSPVVSATRGCAIGVLQAMHVDRNLKDGIEYYSFGKHPMVSKIIMKALSERAPEAIR